MAKAIPSARCGRAGRCEDNPRACPLALDLREDWIGAFPGKIDQQVVPLGDGEREAGGAHRLNRMAVDSEDGAGERTEVDPELRRGCGVDHPQPDAPARFGADDLRIGERARNASKSMSFRSIAMLDPMFIPPMLPALMFMLLLPMPLIGIAL
jgi:hypothetical protein